MKSGNRRRNGRSDWTRKKGSTYDNTACLFSIYIEDVLAEREVFSGRRRIKGIRFAGDTVQLVESKYSHENVKV